MESKFKQIDYSNDEYWRGNTAIQKICEAPGSTKEGAEKWLMRQPLY